MRRFGALSDDEVEDVLSGRETANEELASLIEFAASLRSEATRIPDEATATRRVAAAVEAVSVSLDTRRAESGQPAPIPRRSRSSKAFRSLRTRVAGALAVAGLLMGTTGIAVAADHSAPGDLLHGLDTVLERFGIFNGGETERLAEARALVESGDLAGGLGAVADSVSQAGLEDSSAADALGQAAAQVAANGDTASEAVHTGVVDLLEYLETNLSNLDSETVAAMAHAIVGAAADGEGGTVSVPAETPPLTTGPPATTETPVEDPPPVTTKPPVTTGPPVTTEAPVEDPPPVTTKPPVTTEPPVTTGPPVTTDPPTTTGPVVTTRAP